MNRFRFRLENVLRLRTVEEEKKKREFGIALGRFNLEVLELNRINGEIDSHEKTMEERGQGAVSVSELRRNFNYARALDNKSLKQKKKVKEKEKFKDKKRDELARSTQRKKIIERLKDRDREEYDRAVIKEEQAFIDELTTERYHNPDS
ncbi:flagellar export protein FliJ [bacterium]|nr:flagellar export protein FliJ [bacterium]